MASGRLQSSLSLTDKRATKASWVETYHLHAQELKILLGRTVSAAGIQMDQTTCQRAFADGFLDESACKVIAFSDHTRDDHKLTP